MKSSTIRRSTLSKQSMDVIESLASEQQEDGLGEYVRPDEVSNEADIDNSNKSQEIDLLWQNFVPAQFTSSPSVMQFFAGFGTGVLVCVICFGLFGIYISKSSGGSIFDRLKSNKSAEVQTLEQDALAPEQEAGATVVVPTDDDTQAPVQAVAEQTAQGGDVNTSSNMKKYIVKDGDTVESIIKKNYGSYSPEKAEMIMKANNLKTLDRINIDQELLIPVQ